MKQKSVAVLLIGNELLTGKVRDTNAHDAAKELFARGITLLRVVVVPDQQAEIIEALQGLLDKVDFVITSGGIGPTHDDITVRSVAGALGRQVTQNPQLVARAEKIFGPSLGPEHLRMTEIPEGSELIETERLRWPILAVDRIFVLAGVPKIFRRGLGEVLKRIPQGQASEVMFVYLSMDEWELAPKLNATVDAFPSVLIGSYPELRDRSFRVKVTFEGPEPPLLADAKSHLLEQLPAGVVCDEGRSTGRERTRE